MTATDTITGLLARWQEGHAVHSRVMPLVYADLRRIAGSLFTHERPDHTLQATGLVNEAYIRLAHGGPFESRNHFFAAAANAMRQTLVDYARKRNAEKRGGSFERVELDDRVGPVYEECCEILAMDQALRKLETVNWRQAELTKLRYFAGLTLQEAAEALGVSLSTAKADWSEAKARLKKHLDA